MKKLLFLLLVLPIISFGQWTENFDAGTTLPAGWAVINNGGANGWVFGPPENGTAQSGDNVASIKYDSIAHDDHLITKAINVQVGISNYISFYVKSSLSYYLENYEVLLSTTDQTAASFTTVLQATEKAPSSWTKKSFNLSSYAGQTVYVSIHATDTDQYELYADTFVVNGLPPSVPANDTCSGAVPLAIGSDFNSGAVTSTNKDATTDGTAICQTNSGNNVWFSVVVPASGNITLETGPVSGSTFTDTVMSAYGGTCGSLTQIACNDDVAPGILSSKISLTGQTPGETLYISVWRYTGTSSNTTGQFQISAYDSATLGTTEVTANKNNINVYPNPFAEVLNVSDVTKVRSVTISDVSGRLVKTIDQPTSTLQLGELKSGLYLVTLNMKDGSKQTIKTIKK
ncbi:choice-of-anchor J domain-containing protein [Chryseobacterium sp. ERMR1:04]|uniref:T9SS-dependent choice-of-anchor J family protein n=1 Tax=Chryseobacterium sp. ERMR1:04 TaxID=1705393 RepID=UPI0006C859E2|nr:choice-of-anchor J domain-containing protein [Chryseobacterium sp. ERMR1:04]KPH13478.1 hypothetical protein AMQ68_07800 [Chryseobacterium sp. ERMR1:04]